METKRGPQRSAFVLCRDPVAAGVDRGDTNIADQPGRLKHGRRHPAERKKQLEELSRQIEELRQRLYKLADHGTPDELRAINDELDRMITDFMRLAKGS
ncbi:MAG TPA: hypothetical protein GXX55_06450 [Firmicutes bacterium]|nr:hypothetical protein [Bacillota bacterium]